MDPDPELGGPKNIRIRIRIRIRNTEWMHNKYNMTIKQEQSTQVTLEKISHGCWALQD